MIFEQSHYWGLFLGFMIDFTALCGKINDYGIIWETMGTCKAIWQYSTRNGDFNHDGLFMLV